MGLLRNLFKRKPVGPALIKGRVPKEPTLYRFKALRTFFSQEVASEYSKGEVYSVRQGNDKLDNLVKQWAGEGKVKVL